MYGCRYARPYSGSRRGAVSTAVAKSRPRPQGPIVGVRVRERSSRECPCSVSSWKETGNFRVSVLAFGERAGNIRARGRLRKETGNLRVSGSVSGNEPGISVRCLETSREYPRSWKFTERDRESPRLWSGVWRRAGNIRARGSLRKETGNLRVSGSVAGNEPGISVLVEVYGRNLDLVSVAGNIRARRTSGADLGPDLFGVGRFIPGRPAEFVGAGRARCGRGCPFW